MLHPTQDMDITSSFVSNHDFSSKSLSPEVSTMITAMNERDETDNCSVNIKPCESTFPWLNEFNKMMCLSLEHKSYQLLKHLISLYTQHILNSINTYCEKTMDMMKLKNHHADDCNSYLNQMSVLLGIYIHMELKTSKHTVDSSKLASKLVSALWIYLSHSETHIFRVLLKLEHEIKKYSKICKPIFKRSFANLKDSTEPLADVDYVRYLLALKIWRRTRESIEGKIEVIKIALTILGPCIPKMRDDLFKIIPKPPTEHENKTIWFLQSNAFDLNAACNNFIAFEEASIKSEDQRSKSPDAKLQSSQTALYDVTKSLTNYESKRDESRQDRLKRCEKIPQLKPGEVILIDLTGDDELRIQGKKKKNKKGKRSLEWLKMMKKQRKVQTSNEGQCMNQVEIADAHSTENSENVVQKIPLETLPTSDNKVSESTESCTPAKNELKQDDLFKIVPKTPTGDENKTIWPLKSNAFDSKVACNNFAPFEDKSIKSEEQHSKSRDAKLQSSQNELCDVTKSLTNYESKRDENRRDRLKRCKTESKVKPGKVMLIDMIEDDELRIQGKKKSKNDKMSLEWLKMTKKQREAQTSDEGQPMNQVEIADAHSTENSENVARTILLDTLPTSDNKVSESTESCTAAKDKSMQDGLFKIIPRTPTGHENKTIWPLKSNAFDSKAACNNFAPFEEKSIKSEEQHSKNPGAKLQSSQSALYDVTKSLTNYKSKRHENRRDRLKRCKTESKVKPGKVILIDMFEDDELRIEGKKKSKNDKMSLEWLKMKKQRMAQKSDEGQSMNQVEIADAHSTENSENVGRKILLDTLPISDNKVSESTESCTAPKDKSMQDGLFKIIPRTPTGHENKTIWPLKSNAFEEKSIKSQDQRSKSRDAKLQSSQSALYDVTKSLTNYKSKRHESRRDRLKRYKKRSKVKPGEVTLSNLIEDDELRIVGKKKSKKDKRSERRSLEWLKMTKKQRKAQMSDEGQSMNQVEIADAHSTENSENVARKILLYTLPISDNKVSESTESCTAAEDESIQNDARCNSQNDHIFNKRNGESKCTVYHNQCDTRLKETEKECDKSVYPLKILNTLAPNVREAKEILNLLKDSIDGNLTSQHANFHRNTGNENTQPNSSIETLFSLKECQNNITNVQSIRQELPANGDFKLTEENNYCQNYLVYAESDFQSAISHDAQGTDVGKQKVYRDAHECIDYCKKHELKPFSYNSNIFNTIRNEDTVQNAMNNDASYKKLTCGDDTMCTLGDLDKFMDVLNRVGEHIMNVHAAQQRLECLDKADACDVSTTVSGDQAVESSSDWVQTIGSLNADKLGKILESYEKKDLPRVCSCQESNKRDKLNSNNATIDQVKYESDNYENVTVSTSRSNEYYSCGNDIAIFPENKLLSSFPRSHAKSEFAHTITTHEDNESFGVIKDKAQKPSQSKVSTRTNNQVYDSVAFVDDLKDTKESNQDWELALPNFSQKSNGAKSRSPVNEFDNDILDSILNQSITIEDELEIWKESQSLESEFWKESQSLLMSPMNYDISNTVLSCITEYFSESENQRVNETEDEFMLTENYTEGRLGISLHDFDFDVVSPLNDFMCTNVEPVNTRLSKDTFKDEINDNIKSQFGQEAHTDELKDNISPSQKKTAASTSRNAHKQLNSVDIQQLRNASPRKRQVVSDQKDFGMDTVITEDFVVKDAEYITEENSVNVRASREKTRSSGSNRFSKRNTKVDVTKVRLATDKYATQVSNNILVKPSANTQPSELPEEQLIATVEENSSPKRRRLTSNLSSKLQRNSICKIPVSQQKLLKKRSAPPKKGWINMWHRES